MPPPPLKETVHFTCHGSPTQCHYSQDYILSVPFPFSQVLIPKLKEPDPNPSVVINIMAAIGELVQVARGDMTPCVDALCPIIMEMLQDSSSLVKREVALWTFGQLVENTG